MLNFVYYGNNSRVDIIIHNLNRLLNTKYFADELVKLGSFDYSHKTNGEKLTGFDFLQIIKENLIVPEIQLYKGWWWSKVYGKVVSAFPKTILINSRKLNRSKSSIANTIVHEAIHVLDNYHPLSFGHGTNSTYGKQKSAPYAIGNLIEEIYEE